MNYILKNKLKYEKNRYNKPLSPRIPIVLTHTNISKLPLKMDIPVVNIPIDINNLNNLNNSINLNTFDFKLKNYQMKETFTSKDAIKTTKSINIPDLSIYTSKNSIINKIPYYSDILIINIYGFAHITDKTLYEFLLELSTKFTIRIYIYTYDISRDTIDYYFEGLNVVSVIINNSEKYTDSSRNIFCSTIPLSNWKIMWAGLFNSINQIYTNEDDRTIILLTNFNINYTLNIDFNELKYNKFTKNLFLKNSSDLSGVDNPIIGDKNTLRKLINTFYNNLDNVSMFYSSFKVPEASIFYENNRLFGVEIKDMFENIYKYTK
jgi:hypothetical protein